MDLISGRREGFSAACLRLLLWLASFWYWAAVSLRLALYSLGLLRRRRAGAPVICVGNLTTGGTGKTPAVAHVVQMLAGLRARPAIVSRGYRASASGSDEMKVLAELCPGVLHVPNANRLAGACRALSEGADCIVLDDGFSHLPLARDLDLLLLDALNPFGFGRMLPRGLLREPLRSMRRASAIVITRADVAQPERLREIEDVARCYGFTGPVIHAAHQPEKLAELFSGAPVDLSELRGEVVAPFCGIGNPRGFERTLDSLGAAVSPLGTLVLNDHADLDEREITRQVEPFLRSAREQGARIAVCTQKDAVKLRGRKIELPVDMPLLELRVQFRILRGEEELRAMLARVIAPGN